MGRRSEIRCIGSGVLHSFVSRNNDIDGYWGIGVLCLYAKQVGELNVTVDILTGSVNPSTSLSLRIYRQPNFLALADRYKSMFVALFEKRGVPMAWLTDAVFSIDFNSPVAVPAYPRIGENAEPFLCRLSLKDDLGAVHVFRADGWCWPHNPWRESRSARA